jgi:hypothetical protein
VQADPAIWLFRKQSAYQLLALLKPEQKEKDVKVFYFG